MEFGGINEVGIRHPHFADVVVQNSRRHPCVDLLRSFRVWLDGPVAASLGWPLGNMAEESIMSSVFLSTCTSELLRLVNTSMTTQILLELESLIAISADELHGCMGFSKVFTKPIFA